MVGMEAFVQTHKAALAMPEMSASELNELAEDIGKNGLLVPIELLGGKIIDGRHRFKACKMAGVEPAFVDVDLGDQSPAEYVWSLNGTRRHLTSSQKATVSVELLPAIEEAVKERDRIRKSTSQKIDKSFRSTDEAARITGTNRQYVSDAKKIKEESPDLFDRVKSGELKIAQAKNELKREKKRKAIEEKLAEVKAKPKRKSDCKVIHGDCIEELAKLSNVDLIFTDPPYNIGIDYGSGSSADNLPVRDYLDWCHDWIGLCRDALSDNGTFWLMVPSDLVEHFASMMNDAGLHRRSWVVWYETFGANCSNNFNRTARHLLYYVKNKKQFTFNSDSVNRPSARQEKYNDKRAASGGKIWDDVWQIPRLTGTSDERIPDFPTQLPLELVSAIVGCSSNPGDLVVDPFNGSGPTGVASKQLSRRYIGIEKEEPFWEASSVRIATS